MTFEYRNYNEFMKGIEAIEQLGLDYEVQKATVFVVNLEPKHIPTPPIRVWKIQVKEPRQPSAIVRDEKD